jgi:hypothetical protein
MGAQIRVSSYKGIGIELRPLEIKRGGWIADFTLIQLVGSETVETPYAATVSFPTRELANLAALDFARSIIEENLWRSLAACPKAPVQGYAASAE